MDYNLLIHVLSPCMGIYRLNLVFLSILRCTFFYKSRKAFIILKQNLFSISQFQLYVHCVKVVCIRCFSDPRFPALSMYQYSVQMPENTDQKNSECGHFLQVLNSNTALIILSLPEKSFTVKGSYLCSSEIIMRTVENIWNVKVKRGNREKVVFLYVNIKRTTHSLKLLTVPMIFLSWRR